MSDNDQMFGGRYRIVGEVGRGGMGVIYRGIDSILDREVAIKVMSADFADSSDEARVRFYREARAAARLQHRNIVTVFEFAEQDGVPYIVMEFLRGRSLSARMAAQPPMTLEQKLDVVTELCNGLQFAHENGVIHRDVKPANVWILDDGAVKLVDFGIAKISASMMTMRGDVMGSAAYMSPETIEGQTVTGRSDVFSAAVMLYEMLANRRPFEGESPTVTMMQIVQVPPPPIASLVPNLPPDLVTALAKGLEKNPEQRYQSAAEFGAELQLIRMALPRSEETGFMPEARPEREPVTMTLPFKAEPLQPKAPEKPGNELREQSVPAARNLALSRKALISTAAVIVVALIGYSVWGRDNGPGPGTAPPTETITPQPLPLPAPQPAVRPFAVNTVPSGATIFVNGTKAGVSAATVSVTVGDKVRLQRRGSETQDFTITSADLNRGSGSYTLRQSEPPPGASVRVSITGEYAFEVKDGGSTISSSKTDHEFTSQEGRTLTLYSERHYLNYQIQVRRGKQGEMSMDAPELGWIVLNGENEKCTIYHDGRSLNLPLKSRLPRMGPGKHTFSFVCSEGPTPSAVTVDLKPGQRVDRTVR